MSNALAAAAVGLELGIPLEACAEALARARVSRWRMETFETPEGILVINDAYNANPESMAAALKAAIVMAGDRRVVAVLGHMAELGDIAPEEHERVGELAARLGVDRLITVGTEAKSIAVAGLRGVRARRRRKLRRRRGCARGRSDPCPGRGSGAREGLTGGRARDPGGGAAVISILVAAAVGLAVTLLGTPAAIRAFRVWGWGQRIREDGPHTHLEKMGTPTMGGIVIIAGLCLGYLASRVTAQRFTVTGIALVFATVGFGVVGFLDDFMKVRRQRSLGLTKAQKFGGTALVSLAFALLVTHVDNPGISTRPLVHPPVVDRARRLVLSLGVPRAERFVERCEPDGRAGRPRSRLVHHGVQRLRVHLLLAVPPYVRARAGCAGCTR